MRRIAQRVAPVLVLALLQTLADAQGGPPSTASEWRQNLDEIARDIRGLHPAPFIKVGELTFQRELEALKGAVPSLTEEQRVVGVMRLVASLGDGHTQMEPASARFAYWYPFRLYEFTDGYFITSAHPSMQELAGAEMVEIAGRPVAEVAEQARKLLGGDNPFHRKEKLYALHNAGLMKGLGYAANDGSLQIRVRQRNGMVVERVLRPLPADDPAFKGDESNFAWQFRGEMSGLPLGNSDHWISAYQGLPASSYKTADESRPSHLACRRQCPYYRRAFPKQSAYYIQAYQVDDTDFVPFFRKSLEEVDQLRPRHLIVDFRYNFGGDGSQVAQMAREFVRRAKDPPWKSVYILVGRKTFSAGIMALSALMDAVPATLIGEPPGAALNSYGDATERRYPQIGMVLHVSTLRHQLGASDDFREYIPVDVPALFSFQDYASGSDPALDPILRGEEMRSVIAIALADGGTAAREVWLDRKRRFGQLAWWLPPPEPDFRSACRALAAQKRMSDAEQTCKLSTEVHPFNWHSWFNLGLLYKDIGNEQAKLAAYRCVNLVDPGNHNAEAIRQLLAAAGAENLPPSEGCPTAQ
jgi:hypothetical protein